VENKLAVVPKKKREDRLIAEDVVAALERNSSVNTDDVTVKVAEGAVFLSGTVPSWQAWSAAYESALHTQGVITVRSDMEIRKSLR
jgi:osmotically-inducible protein OsmY